MANKAYQLEFSGTASDEGLYGDVVSLRVEENTITASTFHLQIALRLQDDGSWTYLDDDRFAVFNSAVVKIGFTDDTSTAINSLETVFDGFITSVEVEIGSDPEDAIFNISGMDTSVMMGLEDKIALWPNT